ncbi:MAG TPA: hypothetical protein VFQ39_04490 [Longimicrobium sp.]|nr:hypothetical protein [Longimicrobium sp.]
MSQPFTLLRAHVAGRDEPALLREIVTHTGCEEEASTILRGLERLGTDETIRYFEMTPQPNRRTYLDAPRVTWSVRAVRMS